MGRGGGFTKRVFDQREVPISGLHAREEERLPALRVERARAQVEGALEQAAQQHVAARGDGDGEAPALRGAAAPRLAPDVVPVRVELDDEGGVLALRELAAAEVRGALVGAREERIP